jgi:hypothetical protein
MSPKENPAPGATGDRAGTGLAERQSFTQKSAANQALALRMQLRHWRPVGAGALRGRATILLPSGLEISGVCIFRTAAGTSAALPAEAAKTAAGEYVRNANGTIKYRSQMKWVSRELQQKSSDAVVRLILEQCGLTLLQGAVNDAP